jgi:NAD(P)-dependent dehydrogenase (short-subunit alcohol dehydrogenase family)
MRALFPDRGRPGTVVVMTDTTIALITGGNRGLGRAAALALASVGTDVVLTYRSNADEAAAVVTEIERAVARRSRCSSTRPHTRRSTPSSTRCVPR